MDKWELSMTGHPGYPGSPGSKGRKFCTKEDRDIGTLVIVYSKTHFEFLFLDI